MQSCHTLLAITVTICLLFKASGLNSCLHGACDVPLGARSRSVRSRLSSSSHRQPLRPRERKPGANTPEAFYYNVQDYGAVGDNHTDNTIAFQKAINVCAGDGGGVVFIPAGTYRFSGNLTVLSSVTLKGTYDYGPSHDVRPDQPLPSDGSVLAPLGSRGDASGPPFITMQADSALSGVVVVYPEQVRRGAYPVPFPWTVYASGNNIAITDVELLNSFNGIMLFQAHRHYVARVQGQPLHIGIEYDEIYDIGRIEDVQFNPWYSMDPVFVEYQYKFGRAFVFGRSDWQYVFNTFSFGYAVCYNFIGTSKGSTNGNFLGIGGDYCVNASVVVEASQPPGLLITNGEFTSFNTLNLTNASTHVVTTSTNVGAVRFVDCSFWGPAQQIAYLNGTGLVGFTSSRFSNWNQMDPSLHSPTMSVHQGSLLLQGNEFSQPNAQIALGAQVAAAVVTNNLYVGSPIKVTAASTATDVQESANAKMG